MKKYLLPFLLIGLAPGAWAGETDDFLLGLYRLERCGMMSGSDTAGVDRVEICEELFDEADAHREALAGVLDDEALAVINAKWKVLKKTYDQGLNDPEMFRDHYTMEDMRTSRIAITEALGDRLPKSPNPMALAVHVERMGAEYIWRAESAMGAGMSATEILDLEQMVQEADKQFAALRKKKGDDLAVRAAFAKYQFIRSSLLNYNVDMVPYLVDRYTSSIVESLSSLDRG